MKYCPACGTEYMDEATVCADCGSTLIGETEYREMITAQKRAEEEERMEFNKIRTLENAFQADVLTQALEDEGIRFMIIEHRETAYDDLFIPMRGWGELRVHPEDKERAEKIVGEVLKQISEGEDDKK